MLTHRELRLYRGVFIVATVYNLVWGTFVVLFPARPFVWAGMPLPNYPSIWQCIGMFVLVYAVGYAFLAADPIRYAPFALVALLGKIFGPLGWCRAVSTGQLPAVTGWTIVTNDLIWWPFFFPFVLKTTLAPLRRTSSQQGAPTP